VIPIAVFYVVLSSCIRDLILLMHQEKKLETSWPEEVLNPICGFIIAATEYMKVVTVTSVVACGLTDYMGFDKNSERIPFWLGLYCIFLFFNFIGIEISTKVQHFLTISSLIVLVFCYFCAMSHWSNDALKEGGLITDFAGCMQGFPFGFWFFLGVEELGYMATVLENPHKSVISSTATLTIMAFCTLYLISAVHPGAKEIGKSGKPLMYSVEAAFGKDSTITNIFKTVVIVGLFSSMHSFILYCSFKIISFRQFFPKILSSKNKRFETPGYALALSGFLGFFLVVLTDISLGYDNTAQVLIVVVLICGSISYALTFLAYWKRFHSSTQETSGIYPSMLTSRTAIGFCFFVLAFFVLVLIYLCSTDSSYRIGIGVSFCVLVMLLGLRHCLGAPEFHQIDDEEYKASLDTESNEEMM